MHKTKVNNTPQLGLKTEHCFTNRRHTAQEIKGFKTVKGRFPLSIYHHPLGVRGNKAPEAKQPILYLASKQTPPH